MAIRIKKRINGVDKLFKIAGNGGSGGGSYKVLWTNPNPSSSFSPQNVTLSSSDYDYLIIYFDSGYEKSYIIRNNGTYQDPFYCAPTSSSGHILLGTRRMNFVNSTTLYIDGCDFAYQGSYVTDNTRFIPKQIIGVKL